MSDTTAMAEPSQPQPPTLRAMLFLAEGEPNSVVARNNLSKILETQGQKHVTVEYVNVFDDYLTAAKYGVLVTPCLLVVEPPPRVMVVGTLKDQTKVLSALRIRERE